jgi:hypothetical protein
LPPFRAFNPPSQPGLPPRHNLNSIVFADQAVAGKRPARPRLRLKGYDPMFSR